MSPDCNVMHMRATCTVGTTVYLPRLMGDVSVCVCSPDRPLSSLYWRMGLN